MPDENLPTPEPPPPEQPTLLGNLAPDELLARGMQSVKMTSGTAGTWQPPTVEEANRLFPNYTVLSLLGRGGMGVVYQARQTTLDRLVAIKLLPLEVSVDKDFADRFVREARAMAKLNHPNIITVFDFGTTSEGHLFFVMEFVEGANLADLIHQVGLTAEQALAIVEQVCTALAYAHGKGIVHRDIKPANVMIDTESQVKVADFGLARLTDPSAEQYGHTMTGTVMGTPDYMAPEQMRGMNVDHRADIYSLGVMVYEMLCREVPRGAFEPPSVHVGCDPRIDPIVIKAMQPNPDRRYQSTQEMKTDVAAVRTPLPVAPQPPRPAGAPLPKPPKIPAKPAAPPPTPETAVMQAIPPPGAAKSKTLLYAGIAAGVVVLAAVAFFLFKPKSEPGRATLPRPPGTLGESALPSATKDTPFVNTLGMKFVPVPGTKVLFSIWDTRVQDYAAYAATKKVDDMWTRMQKDGVPLGRESNHPVVGVSWDDAQAFCQWLTEKEQAEGKLPKGMRYRLPTDEEWSIAAGMPPELGTTPAEKAGKNSVDFPWGKDYPPAKTVGNYADETFHAKFPVKEDARGESSKNHWIAGYTDDYATTSPVGSFPANAYGLYDMGGNVWQWCEDWFDASHKDRVVRGGSWGNIGRGALLSSSRTHYLPTDRYSTYGFRCVLEPASSAAPTAVTPAAATKDAPFVNTLGMKFVPVPGTTVLFSVWDTRVQDYAVYAGANPKVDGGWKTQNADGVPAGRELDHPVVGVSWEDAQAFCQWLTEKEQAEGKLPKGLKYRLPSDEEWSWAVGLPPESGTTPAEKHQKNSVDFPWGKDYPRTKRVGNYADETFHAKFPAKEDANYDWDKNHWIAGYTDGYATTSPVGAYPANAYGLYDMGGNVWQWCEDWWDASHKDRVLRGAAWNNNDRYHLLSSSRSHSLPADRHYSHGFRCVVGASVPEQSGAGIPPATTANPTGGTPVPLTVTKDAPLVNSLGMNFVPVPIGSGPTVGQRVLFSVWDTRVQDYAAYAAAKKVDDSWTKQAKDGVPVGRELNHPVVGVSWGDAQAFCQWLTEKEQAEGKLPKGMNYRLPTDEEWSWAVGLPPELGTTPAEKSEKNSVDFPWGKEFPPRQKVGNYADEAFHAQFPPKKNEKTNGMENQWLEGYDDGYATTSPVGSFPANAYGLYDMGGNLLQWCEGWFAASHKDRVLRGAAWDYNDRVNLLSSRRNRNVPTARVNHYGFRCVVGVSETPGAAAAETGGTRSVASQTSEVWEDMLSSPSKLHSYGSVEWTSEGLRFTDSGTALLSRTRASQRNGAVRLRTTFGGLRPMLLARQSSAGVYILFVYSEKTVRLERWNNAPQDAKILGEYPLPEPLRAGQEYELAMRIEGQTLTPTFNGQVLGTATNAAFPEGEFGVRTTVEQGAAPVVVKTLEFLNLDASSAGLSAPTGVRNATKDAPFVNTLGMKFVPVPILGGPTGGKPVLFSEWDTRVQDYEAFVEETKRMWPKPDFEQDPTHPAVMVSWEDAQIFCQWLTGREQTAGRLPTGWSYRLPSDHEWSCAVELGAREDAEKLPVRKTGVIDDAFPWGTQWPPPIGAGNYASEELMPLQAAGKLKSTPIKLIPGYRDGFATTSPVGSFPGNRFGLFDTGGNVWQWCGDWYDQSQKDRVLRGGAWNLGERTGMVSSLRGHSPPGVHYNVYGFRCVLSMSASPAAAVEK